MKRKLAFLLALCILTTLALPMIASAAVAESDKWSVLNVGDTEPTGYSGFGDASAALKDGGTITLLKDVTYTDANIALTKKNITFNGNGKTLTYVNKKEGAEDTRALLNIRSTGTVVINDLKIALGQTTATKSQITALSITGAGADVTLKNCAFTTNRYAVWVTGENAKLTIDGGTYEATKDSVIQLAKAGVECTVNGGTFTQNATAYIFRAETFKTLTVNGGMFIRSGALPIIYAVKTIGGEINIAGGHFKNLAAGNSARYSLMELTHHKVTISGGLFELYDNKTAIGLNGSTYSASDVTAEQKGSLAITGGVLVHNGTLLDTKLNDYFSSVTVDEDAISRYGLAGEWKSYYTEHSGVAMDDGAAVRLVSAKPEDSGIRFTSSVSAELVALAKAAAKEGTEVTFGTILVPTEKLGTTDFTIPALEANGILYQNIVAKEGLEGSDEEGYTLRCALIQIKDSHYDMALSARAYVSWVDANGRTVYVYSSYDEALNSRSISQVAKAALEDITIAYTEAQKAILNNYLGKSSAESAADSNS